MNQVYSSKIMQDWMTNFIRYPTTTLDYALEWSALWFAPICRPEYDSEERSQHWHLHNSLVVIVFNQIQCLSPPVSMSTSALRIGDQLILEEDYDENYIPSEQGNKV